MNERVRYSVADDVALVVIDNPPVNALSPGVPEGIAEAIDRAETDPAVCAVVVMGAGRTFIAGADIAVLEDMAWGRGPGAPPMHDLFGRIEDCAKPVVMAIHGTALGGGLELAMAGHYRVAARDALLGQPEVNLGIIPGAEGTQRLPRLVGTEKALEMCVSGKPIGAADGLAAGLIDALIEGDLARDAVEFARSAGPGQKTRERREKLGSPETNAPFYEAARALAAKTRRLQTAPLRAVEAIAAASAPFDEGCRREREIFSECVVSDQAKSLIHVFFAERAAAKPRGAAQPAPLPIERVGIIGAGTMGGGIAMACANAGLQVALRDTTPEALDAGLATIRRNYETTVARGRLSAEETERRLARIHGQLDWSGFDQADLILEAVYENMALKKSVFAQIDAIARRGCILATNTSTLDIDEIAGATRRPEWVAGLHFFSPANVMRLVEIVRGRATSGEVVATAMALAKRLKKVGVLAGNCRGFIGNRMFFPYMYEAQFLVEDGATPKQADRALTDFGMAMGIFAVDDMAGIDVAWRVRRELGYFNGADERKPLVQDRLCAMGRYGQKTGKGWYVYREGRKPEPDPAVEALIEECAQEAGIARWPVSDGAIVERTVYALVNEGARLIEEGFAQRASDVDVVYVNGYGFPAWRGGPMCFADTVGLGKVLEAVERFEREFGPRWTPAPLLRRLAVEGRTFREFDQRA